MKLGGRTRRERLNHYDLVSRRLPQSRSADCGRLMTRPAPYWPAKMKVDLASAYVDESQSTFRLAAEKGRLYRVW